jgi:chaperonin GroES
MKVRPLGDRILVQRIEEENVTQTGIVLPESAKERSQRGTVVRVGDGRQLESGERAAFQVKEGDTVLLPKFGAQELNIEGNKDESDYLMVREEELLAVLDS